MAALRRVPSVDLNEPLYHFTDRVGLEGILETRSLWASLATSLEDTSEIVYALERAKLILEPHEGRPQLPMVDEIIPLLEVGRSRTISMLGLRTYILSFRTNVDAKAHWESYGRSGTGFALGFGLKPLLVPGTLAFPVLYKPRAQEALLRDFIDECAELLCRLLRQCPVREREALKQRAAHWTALGLWTLAPVLKDAARFEHENEWRLIVTDLENVQIHYGKGLSAEVRKRVSNGREIPYKVLQYDSLPIVGLELGPKAPIAENDANLIALLNHATAGRAVPIRRSTPLADQAG